MDVIVGLVVIFITSIYLQVICNRDKKFRREIQQYNKNVKAEEKRRIREEKLKTMRVKHPKVIYLSDYRPIVEVEPSKIS